MPNSYKKKIKKKANKEFTEEKIKINKKIGEHPSKPSNIPKNRIIKKQLKTSKKDHN